VFTRLLHQEKYYASHIHTYNLETGAEGLVTTLDYRTNTPASGATIGDLAVSPDRSQVVFSSAAFRPDPVQVTESLRMDALWTTDLEGKDFRRLTPDYKPDFNQGFPCGTSTPNTLPCLTGEVCRLNRCVREDLRVALSDMVWTPSGKIFHHSFHSWWRGTTDVYQFGYLLSVTPDGRHEFHDLPGKCRSVNPGDVSPSTQQLLIFRDGCESSVAYGMISFSLDPFQERQVLVPESPELDMNVSRGRFSPDEKTFYFIAQGATRKPVGISRRTGLYRLTLQGLQSSGFTSRLLITRTLSIWQSFPAASSSSRSRPWATIAGHPDWRASRRPQTRWSTFPSRVMCEGPADPQAAEKAKLESQSSSGTPQT
jgi:hypothetical protein